jgi:tripartite-type tricarboxylate transporter receptor subunit TctC
MSKRCLAAAVAVVGIVASASAQDYPSRPLTMIVPYPAGGVTDALARLFAERMKTALGQTITIENVGGAAGSIGVGRAVRALPDGYTFLMGNT